MVAILFLVEKLLSEECPDVGLMSVAGCLPKVEIVRLETDILQLLDYRVLPSEEEFQELLLLHSRFCSPTSN